MKNVIVKVDGIGINATHYTVMDKDKAVKAMETDGVFSAHKKDAAWGGQVYDLAVKAVADAKKKDEEEVQKKNAKNKKLGVSTAAITEEKLPPGVASIASPGK